MHLYQVVFADLDLRDSRVLVPKQFSPLNVQCESGLWKLSGMTLDPEDRSERMVYFFQVGDAISVPGLLTYVGHVAGKFVFLETQ